MKESYIAAKERWARKMAGQHQPIMAIHCQLLPSLRDADNKNGAPPSVETLGYFQNFLRDSTEPPFKASTL